MSPWTVTVVKCAPRKDNPIVPGGTIGTCTLRFEREDGTDGFDWGEGNDPALANIPNPLTRVPELARDMLVQLERMDRLSELVGPLDVTPAGFQARAEALLSEGEKEQRAKDAELQAAMNACKQHADLVALKVLPDNDPEVIAQRAALLALLKGG